MTATQTLAETPAAETEHFDVLIVGAGISGIGAAYHLTHQRPGTSFVILDALDHFGGTWWTHKYPGVRSDSDLYTFGYRFKPWVGAPIATAGEILRYMDEVIEENDLAKYIRYSHKVLTAKWSTETSRWTIEANDTKAGVTRRFTANFLWMCQGYYRHEQGYTPEWPGMDQYQGQIIHPQTWPKDLDLKGKKVICIGSGATTATVVPAIAGECEHVTVLQRSPTYFIPGRNQNELADILREIDIPEEWIHEIVRRKILHDQAVFTQRSFDEPETVKNELLTGVRAYLGPDYDVDKHFTPSYRPWRQRIAFVPDGDIFRGIRAGKASVVTDEIDTFTPRGIRTKSGEELEADIIITATGFNMNALGDIAFEIDGKPLAFHDTVTYRGMMFTGIPNLLWVFGYFRASWTLRADLMADFVCRLLAHMEKKGVSKVKIVIPEADKDMKLLPWIDPENFNPGYLMRAMDILPMRGEKHEWQHTQDYWREKDEIPAIDLDGPEFQYS
ncbi:MAG TPA: NAD(P)/FAD-dependent oxidoreductase [Tepidiformaceae bacterium]|nr:NAD(P)/FAD-dependent oxidoreductase [Tepidiformaceae bacterium]